MFLKNVWKKYAIYDKPVIFNMENDQLLKTTSKSYVSSNYGAFEVKVRNVVDVETDNMYLPLTLKSVIKLLNEDKRQTYYSENNSDFFTRNWSYKKFTI